MLRCDSCPHPAFEKFYEYYGKANYGDKWVMAAFDGKATSFKNGNADFSKATNESRVGKFRVSRIALLPWPLTDSARLRRL